MQVMAFPTRRHVSIITMPDSLGPARADTVGAMKAGSTTSNTLLRDDVVIEPAVTDSTTTAPPGPDELEALVRDHLDAVYRVAFSVVRDSALAEDVSQDALLKAWKALPTFRAESSLRSWLLRITHNTAVSTLRKRREEVRDPDMLPESKSSSSTERQVLGSMSIDDFSVALDTLDELSRSIIVLREVEGMSYDEIGETLQVPLPTVKTRLLRARRTLAMALEGWK